MMDVTKLISQADGPRRDTVTVGDLTIEVREPTYGVYARYGQLYGQGEMDAAVACLLKGCVLDDKGAPGLDDDQAYALATADKGTIGPIMHSIFGLMKPPEKKADAPGADGVQGGDGPGADAD